MIRNLVLCLATIVAIGCSPKTAPANPETLKQEVAKAETDFKDMAQTKGIQEAFYTFADDHAVIKRDNDSLIEGREAIKNYFGDPKYKTAKVTWKADFIDVSDDGTLAYTYGKYVWTATDSLGVAKDYKGRFHTVWKKQKDGSWKYVWD